MISEILSAHAAEARRAFSHDRNTTAGASEIADCERKNWFKKHGGPREEGFVENWGYAERGRQFEDNFWVPALRRRFRAKLLYAGRHQRTFVSGDLSATPDGLVIGQPCDALAHLGVNDLNLSFERGSDAGPPPSAVPGPARSIHAQKRRGCFAVECKTVDPRTRLERPKVEHEFQVQAQLGLLRALTPHDPNYALISYTNASDFSDTREFVVAFDPEIFRDGASPRHENHDREIGRGIGARRAARRRRRVSFLPIHASLRAEQAGKLTRIRGRNRGVSARRVASVRRRL